MIERGRDRKDREERVEDILKPRLQELGEILTEYMGLLLRVRRKKRKEKGRGDI